MSELDEFRSTILARQLRAEEAMHQGDPEPRLKLWSRRDPVSLIGGWGPNKFGWEDVSRTFRWVASRFSKGRDYRWDIEVAYVSGDLGYTVGYERSKASIDGGPVEEHKLRVTHVYRREDGEWKIVHRHGDIAPVDQSPPKDASTAPTTIMSRSGQP
jgi:ketosteroid isomerase-like protein